MTGCTAYPGYRYAYGSTSGWFREPGGPFVAITYSEPNADGLSARVETFHDTNDEARRAALTRVGT